MLKLTNSELRSVAKGRIVGYRGVFRKELEDLLSKVSCLVNLSSNN